MQKMEQPSLFPLIKFCKYTSLFSLFRGNTLWKRSNFPKSQGDTKQPSQVHLVAGEQCRNQSWVHMNCSIWDFGHKRMYVRKISWKVTSSSLSKFAFLAKCILSPAVWVMLRRYICYSELGASEMFYCLFYTLALTCLDHSGFITEGYTKGSLDLMHGELEDLSCTDGFLFPSIPFNLLQVGFKQALCASRRE